MEMIMCIVADVGVVSSLPSPSHNIVCLPADRFQMLMAGSRGEGAAGEEEGGRDGYSLSLGGGEALHALWNPAQQQKTWAEEVARNPALKIPPTFKTGSDKESALKSCFTASNLRRLISNKQRKGLFAFQRTQMSLFFTEEQTHCL